VQARLVRLYGARKVPVVTLVEAHTRVLPRLSDWAGRVATRRLSALGVRVLTGVMATQIAGGHVGLDDGRAPSAGTVIWAGGNIQAPHLAAASGLADATGRIPVTGALEAGRYPGVFALGDCAYHVDRGVDGCEPSAHRAEEEATTVARNIIARLTGRRVVPHRPSRDLYLLGLGPGYGVLEAGSLRAAGWGPSVLKELVMARHLLQAGGWRVLRAASPRVVLDPLQAIRWETNPLPDGVVGATPAPRGNHEAAGHGEL
jgi:NADH dehydrogenase